MPPLAVLSRRTSPADLLAEEGARIAFIPAHIYDPSLLRRQDTTTTTTPEDSTTSRINRASTTTSGAFITDTSLDPSSAFPGATTAVGSDFPTTGEFPDGSPSSGVVESGVSTTWRDSIFPSGFQTVTITDQHGRPPLNPPNRQDPGNTEIHKAWIVLPFILLFMAIGVLLLCRRRRRRAAMAKAKAEAAAASEKPAFVWTLKVPRSFAAKYEEKSPTRSQSTTDDPFSDTNATLSTHNSPSPTAMSSVGSLPFLQRASTSTMQRPPTYLSDGRHSIQNPFADEKRVDHPGRPRAPSYATTDLETPTERISPTLLQQAVGGRMLSDEDVDAIARRVVELGLRQQES